MEETSTSKESNEVPTGVSLMSIPLEGDVVPLEDVEQGEKPVITTTLVGKIICNKTLNKGAVKDILRKAWGEPTSLSIADLGPNCFMFNFTEDKTPKKIMEDSPWNVMGQLLSLQWWCPWSSIAEVDYDMVPFWVQAHGIPLEALNSRTATKIGERLGVLMEVEDPMVDGRMLRSFLRMRVLINIKQALTTGFWVPRKEKSSVWVWLKYEKLQNYCFQCGRIGHESKDCKEERAMSLLNPKLPRFGPGMGVAVPKSLEAIRRENEGKKMKVQDSIGRSKARVVVKQDEARVGEQKDTIKVNSEDMGYGDDLHVQQEAQWGRSGGDKHTDKSRNFRTRDPHEKDEENQEVTIVGVVRNLKQNPMNWANKVQEQAQQQLHTSQPEEGPSKGQPHTLDPKQDQGLRQQGKKRSGINQQWTSRDVQAYSNEAIEKSNTAVSTPNQSPGNVTTVVINQEIGLCPWQIVKETSGSSYYYVEFPEEEGKHDYNTGGRSRIDEGKLASSFHRS